MFQFHINYSLEEKYEENYFVGSSFGYCWNDDN